jgi:hypothetical protein
MDSNFATTKKTRFAEYNAISNTLTIADYAVVSRVNARNQLLER